MAKSLFIENVSTVFYQDCAKGSATIWNVNRAANIAGIRALDGEQNMDEVQGRLDHQNRGGKLP